MRRWKSLPTVVVSTALILVSVASVVLPQQAQSTTTPESLLVVPDSAASNTPVVQITLIAADGSMFARPSGRVPDLEAGAGITVSEFVVDSPKQAHAKLAIAATAFGPIELRCKVYSLNGQTVTVLATTYFSALGPISNPPLTVQVVESRKVSTDTPLPQTAGNITLKGPLVGSFTLTAPAGVTFFTTPTAQLPAVTSQTPGVIPSKPVVASDGSSFAFTVANARNIPGTLTLQNLQLNLANYTTAGAKIGAITFTLGQTGGGQSFAVSSAHTPGQTVENPDNALVNPPANTNTNTAANSNTANTNTASNSASSSSAGTQTILPRVPYNAPATNNGLLSSNSSSNNSKPTIKSPSVANNRSRLSNGNPNFNGNNAQLNQPAVRPVDGPGPAAAQPTSGAPNAVATPPTGTAGTPATAKPSTGPPATAKVVEMAPTVAARNRVVDTIVIGDERFRPLMSLGLKPAADGRFVARVWVEVVLVSDTSPNVRDTLTVDLSVPGAGVKRVELTELEPNSGIYRCDPSGIELVIDCR